MNEYGQPRGGDSQTLDRILLEQKKLLRVSRLRAALLLILAAAIVLSLLLVVPRVLRLADQAGTAISEIERVMPELETLMEDAGTMMKQNGEAMQKINGVDFDKLNQAIDDLAAAVKPLGDVGRFFTGGQGN